MAQRLTAHVLLQRPGVRRFRSRVRTWHCLASRAVVGSHIESRGRWARMLAQGQASSAKRGGLAVVSSRLIFLKNKQTNKQNKKKLLVMFNSSISLLIFCIVVLLTARGEVLTFPTVVMDLFISPFWFIKFYLTYFGTKTFKIIICSWWINLLIIM